jgi:hypothetical protein
MRTICFSLAAAMLAACASTPTSTTTEQTYLGTVEKTSEVTRPNERGSPALYMFGLVGGLMNAALSKSKKTNLYVVKSEVGEVSAHSDERFAIGDCVQIIPAKGAPAGLAYAYGKARVVASSQCTPLAQTQTGAAGSTSENTD